MLRTDCRHDCSTHNRLSKGTHLPRAIRALDPEVILARVVLTRDDFEDVIGVFRLHRLHGVRHPLRDSQLLESEVSG